MSDLPECDLCGSTAHLAAIRAHLLSDETVERAGRALYIGNTPIGADIARKALEAALGGGD